MSDLYEAQLAREQVQADTATAEHVKRLLEAIEGGRIDEIPAAKRIIARMFGDVRAEMEKVVNATARGPGAALRGWLRKVPLDTLTVLSMRLVLTKALRDSQDEPATLQRICQPLGRAIEQEARVQAAYAVNPAYVDRTWDYLKDSGTKSPRHIHKTMQAVTKNVLGDTFDGYLSNTEYIQLGKHGLNACLLAGLVEQRRGTSAQGTMVTFTVPEAIQDALRTMPNLILGGSQYMLAPPIPWDSGTGGGYYSPAMQVGYPLRRIGTRTRRGLRPLLRENLRACAPVLRCANYLQAHAFEFHAPTLRLVREVWRDGGGVLGIPKRNPPPEPQFPHPEGWDKGQASEQETEQFHAWKRQMHRWHQERNDIRKAQIAVSTLLKAAYGDHETVWFPVFIDSRGRYYYRGALNPQGVDFAKALIQFKEKRPLGERGLYWLRVHIANCFGEDKARFDDREAWTRKHEEALLAALDSPADSDLFRGNTDAPVCAFAALWELREALRSGDPASYCTGLPIHMDATCSGLQHFSALLRDEVGGHYVNLADDGLAQKADIYRRVAEMAKLRIERDAHNANSPTQHLAAIWMTLDIPRSLAKKPVMTYVYGATMRGVASYVADHLEETGVELPEDVRIYTLAGYMAKVLFQAIEDTVPAAAECMRWLQQRAKQADRFAPMLWHSPTGLLVEHDYRDFEEKRIKIRSCGLVDVVVREELDVTRPLPMQNAIAPNFVHALDAAHLTFTARRMEDSGLCMVAIHDSFGTHPCDVDAMHGHIRDAFVELYDEHDPIGLLLRGAGQQEVTPPRRGALVLQGVQDSEFFFC